MAKEGHIALFSKNQLEYLELVLYGWFKGLKMYIIGPAFSSPVLAKARRIPFIAKYFKGSIEQYPASLTEHKGLWFKISDEAIDLTLEFYDNVISRDNRLIGYYNKRFKTRKFEAHIKKEITYSIFMLLQNLHLIRVSDFLRERSILAIKSPLTRHVVDYMERQYNIKYKIKWVHPVWGFPFLCMYYAWLCKEIIKRGFVFNKKKKSYKISREATWGFHRRTLRDDIVIDNQKFKPKDILMLELHGGQLNRKKAFDESKERGFDTASVPGLKININRDFFNILSFYFLIPLRSYVWLSLNKQSYLFYYIAAFHKRSFPIETLMNLYDIKCYISTRDSGDTAETIVFNSYGTKSAVFHWSDLTAFRDPWMAFIAHNVYFAWGDIHYECQQPSETYFVDKKINIGCIHKKEVHKIAEEREKSISRLPNFRKDKKTVAFFDTAFGNYVFVTENIFLGYLELIEEFCAKNKDVNILLKPKSPKDYEGHFLPENRGRYKTLWNKLTGRDNFIRLDPHEWGGEEVIAISDVCVTLGMNSPSTIALICGKDALYFEKAGNIYHPFAKKYKDIIVFDNKEPLLGRISDILDGKFKCKDVITERELRGYDAYKDDMAIERLRGSLYELTKG